MKKICLMFVMSIMCISAIAQNRTLYQGELNLGYGFGMGDLAVDRFYVETIHGIRVNPNLFIGAGLGLISFDHGRATIPVFADVKAYIAKGGIQPYVYANLGYGFGDEMGFYGAGGVGVDFSIASKTGIFINLGYQSQGLKDNIQENGLYGPSNMAAFMVQLGFRF